MRLSPFPFIETLRWGREQHPQRDRVVQAEAFRAIILPHLDAAYNLARYIVRDPSLCDEIVQDSFERALKAFDSFRGGSARAWLLTIVRNRCRTELTTIRRTGLRVIQCDADGSYGGFGIEDMVDPSESPEDHLIRNQGIQHVRDQISALPEPFREALVLRELEELSYKEIAQVTGVALGTVMSRLSRARSLLAQALFQDNHACREIDRKAADEQLR